MDIRYSIGIDPGITGGLALIDLKLNKVYTSDMPTMGEGKTKQVDSEAIKRFFYRIFSNDGNCTPYSFIKITLEKSQPMPGQGVTSMFNYGVTYGKILGAIEGMGLRESTIEVRPNVWKKVFNLNKNKRRSIRVAGKMFPEIKDSLTIVGPRGGITYRDGAAEALLLAEYGRISV